MIFVARALTSRDPKKLFFPKLKNGGFCLANPLRVRAQGFGMEAPDWEACSFELARTLVDAASRDLADA